MKLGVCSPSYRQSRCRVQFSVSEALDWMRCQRYWYNRNVVRRSVPPTQTMDDGTYWHELARHALVPSANTPDPEPLNDAQRAMHAFMPTALAELTRDWDVVEIERPHAIKLGALGAHTLVGTPDGTVRQRASEALYLLQWKTTASGQPLDLLWDQVRVSWHECAYQAMVERDYERSVAGTLLGVWRKLSGAARARGEQSFMLIPLARTAEQVATALAELERVGDMIMLERVGALDLIPNRRSCTTWNSRCQYFGVCYGGRALTDSEFVQVEERYAPEVAT